LEKTLVIFAILILTAFACRKEEALAPIEPCEECVTVSYFFINEADPDVHDVKLKSYTYEPLEDITYIYTAQYIDTAFLPAAAPPYSDTIAHQQIETVVGARTYIEVSVTYRNAVTFDPTHLYKYASNSDYDTVYAPSDAEILFKWPSDRSLGNFD